MMHDRISALKLHPILLRRSTQKVFQMNPIPRIASLVFVLMAASQMTHAAGAPDRVVHRYLDVAMSPDGKHVAAVEGDSSPSGGEPVIRSLVIRSMDGNTNVDVALPCGRVRECWPSSPVWNADGTKLVFALR